MSQQGRSVAVIGSGFAGIGMAIRLTQAGYEDVTIFERANEIGGTWRDNTYPGAACDVPSDLYSFSFEPRPHWSRRFAPQAEILDYLRHCADKYDVKRLVRCGTEVRAARFDEDASQWALSLSDGTLHRTDILVAACGQLSRPAWPAIPGLADFGGTVFHSAEWDHEHVLDGKHVAVVGTGASAIQFVPQIAPRVASLRVFQRDAPYVIPKPDFAYPPSLQALFRRVPLTQRLSRTATYCMLEPRAVAFTRLPQLMRWVERRFERHLASQVPDTELRARLRPTYQIGCKRILISNDYYPALTLPQVEVVSDAIEAVTPAGIRTEDGTLHEVDTLILGTGFRATEFLAPMEVVGRDGRSLREEWRDGAEAHLGINVAGFPNLFLLYGPNSNLGHSSIIYMLESQIGYVLKALERLDPRRGIEVRGDVQARWSQRIQQRLQATVWDSGCASWYRTAAGRNSTNWPGFAFSYRLALRTPHRHDFVS